MLAGLSPGVLGVAGGQVVFGVLSPTRAALIGAVLLLALVFGPWLARRAGSVPERVDPQRWHARNKRGQVSHRERRVINSAAPFITWVTLVSVWAAAAVAIGYILLYDNSTTPEKLFAGAVPIIKGFGLRLGGSLLVVALTLSIGRILQRIFVSSLSNAHLSENLLVLGRRTIYLATMLLGALIVLEIWGTGLVLPVTVLGALTVALSLALQGLLSNLVAGVYLLVEHPFTIGQTITANEKYTGVVEDIRLRVTMLRLESGERALIPNALVFGGSVINRSASAERRAELKVTVPDAGDKKVHDTLAKALAAVRSAPDVLATPAPEARVVSTGGGKLTFEVAFWLVNGRADHEAPILAAVIERMRGALGDVDISDMADV